jgi:hypothetical protein
MLSFGRRLIVAALTAPAICALLYWIDDDPPYSNVWHTVQEFSFISAVILFPLMLGITWFFRHRKTAA